MPNQNNNRESSIKGTAKTFTEKVRLLQKRVRQERFVSDGSSDKPMMDEVWGEDGDDLPPFCFLASFCLPKLDNKGSKKGHLKCNMAGIII